MTSKPKTEKELLREYLTDWRSAFQCCDYLKTSQADRRIRELAERGELENKWTECEIAGKKKRYKIWKMKGNNNEL